MSKVFLTNFTAEADILCYDLDTGASSRHPKREMPRGQEPDRGFFVETDGLFFGVSASGDGPVFFAGNQRTLLERGRHTGQIRRGDASNRFALMDGEVEIAAVWYRPVEPSYTNPYDQDESFSDFFVWLRDALGQENFFARHVQVAKTLAPDGEHL